MRKKENSLQLLLHIILYPSFLPSFIPTSLSSFLYIVEINQPFLPSPMLGIEKVLANVQTAAAQPWKVTLSEEPTGLRNLRHLYETMAWGLQGSNCFVQECRVPHRIMPCGTGPRPNPEVRSAERLVLSHDELPQDSTSLFTSAVSELQRGAASDRGCSIDVL